MKKKEDKTDLVTLLEIRHIIEKSSLKKNYEELENINKFYSEIQALHQKFDELKDFVVGVKKKGESPKKIKTKREVIALLQKYKRLNPKQLAELIGLSRVRANEYLRELENDKIVKGIIVNRKKFYMLEGELSPQFAKKLSENPSQP